MKTVHRKHVRTANGVGQMPRLCITSVARPWCPHPLPSDTARFSRSNTPRATKAQQEFPARAVHMAPAASFLRVRVRDAPVLSAARRSLHGVDGRVDTSRTGSRAASGPFTRLQLQDLLSRRDVDLTAFYRKRRRYRMPSPNILQSPPLLHASAVQCTLSSASRLTNMV